MSPIVPLPAVRRRLLAAALLTTAIMVSGAESASALDWHGVEVAWRNDPRPPSDAPLPAEPQPRRMSRRAQRRLQRRDAAETPRDPSESADEVKSLIHRDQAYGDHPRQRLDLYLPEGCAGGLVPLVVWIHGPDWKSGSKADCPVTWLADDGYVVASVDYRTSDMAMFPAQLDDCRSAIERLVSDAATWGIDPDRICVMGSGAGGHLAALVGMAEPPSSAIRATSTDDDSNAPSATPAAIVTIDAPTDLPALGGPHDRAGSPESRLVGGPLPEVREAAQRASPAYHASADDPPMLIVHDAHGTVSLDQSRRLEESLRAVGVDATVVAIDGSGGDAACARDTQTATRLLEFLSRSLGDETDRHE